MWIFILNSIYVNDSNWIIWIQMSSACHFHRKFFIHFFQNLNEKHILASDKWVLIEEANPDRTHWSWICVCVCVTTLDSSLLSIVSFIPDELDNKRVKLKIDGRRKNEQFQLPTFFSHIFFFNSIESRNIRPSIHHTPYTVNNLFCRIFIN